MNFLFHIYIYLIGYLYLNSLISLWFSCCLFLSIRAENFQFFFLFKKLFQMKNSIKLNNAASNSRLFTQKWCSSSLSLLLLLRLLLLFVCYVRAKSVFDSNIKILISQFSVINFNGWYLLGFLSFFNWFCFFFVLSFCYILVVLLYSLSYIHLTHSFTLFLRFICCCCCFTFTIVIRIELVKIEHRFFSLLDFFFFWWKQNPYISIEFDEGGIINGIECMCVDEK